MDFMKVLDQTVREIKREVNLRVLKVPEIEQKVLDATDNEPWGPHGTALQEIAQGTKKFTECQMIMNVLWTRLTDTGPNWRHVYKALTVIEYLVANGSERAVDDILEHIFQISAISGFEYVEPNGKDMGINVRKKVETILALLNDKEKTQAVREKAAANRDKYFGLSSTGITYKSSSASYGSSSYSSDHYGSLGGSGEGDSFSISYKEGDNYGKDTKWNRVNKDSQQSQAPASGKDGSELKKGVANRDRGHDSKPSVSSKQLNTPSVLSSSESSRAQMNSDDDDFDPRGSSTTASAKMSSNQVDLFGESLVGDLLDDPVPTKTSTYDSATISEADLFSDATFQSASPHGEPKSASRTQGNVDLFASQPVFPTMSSNVDFFAAPDASLPSEKANPISQPANTNSFDPFAAIPINNFEGSDHFDAFTSQSKLTITGPSQDSNKGQKSLDKTSVEASDFGAFTSHSDQTNSGLSQHSSCGSVNVNPISASKTTSRKDTFQVKSGIWADSLSRGLIDLNISAPKKVNLADIGIVGGLDDGSDDKQKGASASAYMWRSMGTGSGLGRSEFPPSAAMGGFSTLGQQQFGSFK